MTLKGVELIAIERQEQVDKHGFGPDHDAYADHDRGELVAAAVYLLSKVPRGEKLGLYPKHWAGRHKFKFDEKTRLEKLVVAGALIAAEIDRIQRDSL